MSQYAAEPVPAVVDPILAEYLMRQTTAIQNALSYSIVLEVPSLPARTIPGAMVNLNDRDNPAQNGFYVCVYDGQGEAVWKKLQVA
jgi:hypothetical protein